MSESATIETPDPSDPLTPARLAIRVLWCAAADDAVMFDPPRIRLQSGGPVHDEMSAAAVLLTLPVPTALAATPDGEVLGVRASAPSGEIARPSWIFESLAVRNPDEPTIVAWTAGRGLRVPQRSLIRAASAFRLAGAGFVGAWGKGQPVPQLAAMLGVRPGELDGVEWVLLAGRTGAPVSPRGESAPLRRVNRRG